MKKLLLILSILILFLIPTKVFAIENPLDKPNNRFGIHILFPEEIQDAAKLVNSNSGDWGFVTIPIQAGDRNLEKWQKFMDQAGESHVIPIIRLATEGDYFNTKVWRKPNEYDIVDFANFLNSLDWPVKNRYIIVFNETNRGDEWGGTPNASEYADILKFASVTFKNRNDDFFILSGGLDNGASNVSGQSIDEYTYFKQMNESIPGIFSFIDGLSSHSYPNPGFSQPPSKKTPHSITSFIYEEDFIKNLSGKDLPVFITETGWAKNTVSEDTISEYLQDAFTNIWANNQIVAVTPFLLKAGGGPFEKFSFLTSDNGPTKLSEAVANLPKIKGEPHVNQRVLGDTTEIDSQPVPFREFKTSALPSGAITVNNSIKTLLKWLIRL